VRSASLERDLWPAAEIPEPAATSVELVAGFAHTTDASPTWQSLLAEAAERIWLLDFTLIDVLSGDGTPALLADKARRGVEVRLLLSYATRARLATDTPIDEPYPDPEPPAVYDIARARGHIDALLDVEGVEARKFVVMRFNTIVCADERCSSPTTSGAYRPARLPRSICAALTSPACLPNTNTTTSRSGITRRTRSRPTPTCSRPRIAIPATTPTCCLTTRPPIRSHDRRP
jgi:hypothetical protein